MHPLALVRRDVGWHNALDWPAVCRCWSAQLRRPPVAALASPHSIAWKWSRVAWRQHRRSSTRARPLRRRNSISGGPLGEAVLLSHVPVPEDRPHGERWLKAGGRHRHRREACDTCVPTCMETCAGSQVEDASEPQCEDAFSPASPVSCPLSFLCPSARFRSLLLLPGATPLASPPSVSPLTFLLRGCTSAAVLRVRHMPLF